ncbi:hypothetical protein BJY52DRAFT_1216624 [Lactarius psammicola]|nr:hypothetical protein BJY52DRAFT_1216624 [Lactarius psammicola]
MAYKSKNLSISGLTLTIFEQTGLVGAEGMFGLACSSTRRALRVSSPLTVSYNLGKPPLTVRYYLFSDLSVLATGSLGDLMIPVEVGEPGPATRWHHDRPPHFTTLKPKQEKPKQMIFVHPPSSICYSPHAQIRAHRGAARICSDRHSDDGLRISTYAAADTTRGKKAVLSEEPLTVLSSCGQNNIPSYL